MHMRQIIYRQRLDADMTKHTNTHYAIKWGGIQDTCNEDIIDYLGRTGLSMHYYCPLCGELMEVHPYDEEE